jgi:predicted O-methyltransferase YrrM
VTSLTYDKTQEYLVHLVPPREAEMRVMERYARRTGFPIVGPAAGYACYQIARMISATSVFEMGSGYGYSTAWFAKAVKENGGGVVHHVVWDAKLSEKARKHLSALGYGRLLKFHVAEAIQTLRQTPGPFDLIFTDIEKQDYPEALPLIKRRLRRGGVLVIDNMLWSGRIFDRQDTSSSTNGVRRFTKLITNDSDWVVSLLPIRDGLIVALKN